MKTRSLLAFVALMLIFPLMQSHALERSVPLPYDYSRSVNAGTYIPKCAVSETLVSTGSGYVCDSTLKKMASCMGQKKLYAPAQVGADANGCVDAGAAAVAGSTCGMYKEVKVTAPYGGFQCMGTVQAVQHCPGDSFQTIEVSRSPKITVQKLICPEGYTATRTSIVEQCTVYTYCSDHGGSNCTPGSSESPLYGYTCVKN